jgi:tetratricopeptide (TPR) repeat protein
MRYRFPTLALVVALAAGHLAADEPSAQELVSAAEAAESRLDSARALELYLAADRARPDDPFILQKISRQYSDLEARQETTAGRLRYIETALEYAERAIALDPSNAVNVLSRAICHGKLAVLSDTRTKVRLARRIREDAERAVALDPNYAWAHHILGRWHLEAAELNMAERLVLRIFFGGFPEASVDDAVRHLRRAMELEPGELAHEIELGFALAAAGRPAEARKHWESGLALASSAPHHELSKQRARAALARL